ncbi:MAG: TonB-dependent receptor [Pseudomonadota bacterium]|nr:TonB-dependent receptor [Pseudomonadota bacterium]
MRRKSMTGPVLFAGALVQLSTTADVWAQSAAGAEAEQQQLEEVIVTGTNIRGSEVTTALPVVTIDQDQIAAIGAINGDDLLRSIPQMGDVLFEAANNPQTSNSARGDVNSVNLRSLGVGNTLVLLNGRRLVPHPTSQGTSDTGTVPVQSFNANAVPVSGLERLEVLLDGAAAIYGADAVAGVVNTILKSDYEGLAVSTQYGGAEGTNMREFEFNVHGGQRFDRGHLAVFANYTDRSSLDSADQDFTRSDDMRAFFNQFPGYENSVVPDGRSSHSPWAQLSVGPGRPVIRQGTTALTTAAGAFHVQPSSMGCDGVAMANDICLVRGTVAYSGANRDLRYDTRHDTTVRPSVERVNVYLTGEYELSASLTAFGEVGFYGAESRATQPPVVNLNGLWIPASNYYNPFGPTTFADGTSNPNRLPGLTNVPAAGLPIRLGNYRFVDTGFQQVTVKNYQSRFVTGLRGQWGKFDWESAVLYSEAQAKDISPNIDMTAFQQQLALSTPDAYNPFGGGCVATQSFGDCSASSPAAVDAITFDLRRISQSSLTLADFKMNSADLFLLPAGAVGIAFGVEGRRETQRDDRDANLDGTKVFVDMVSGETNLSNVSAVSPNPDTSGSRTVAAAYVEFAVPVISSEMSIPLVRALDFQVAGRYEHYDDFGSVTKPKIAMAWDLVDGVRMRASYSQGFRAPNLEQTNATQYARLSTPNDFYRCEADIRAGRIASMNECARANSLSLLVSGNPDLEPEESTSKSIGLVFQPQFLPASWGDFTLTVDRWQIEQEKIVGLLGAPTAMALDYLNRIQGGANPAVLRAPVDADDAALFAGTGLTPVGEVISVSDRFVNLLPQTVEGVDFGITWALRRTRFGDFTVRLNGAKLLEFTRAPGPVVDSLYQAREAGTIAALTPLPDSTRLIAQNGRPEWKASSSVIWDIDPWRFGLTLNYVSEVEQLSLLSATGEPWVVDDQLLTGLYTQYELKAAGFASNTRVRLGVRDLTDEGPSLADGGYLGSVQVPYGRYWYMNLSKTF